MHGVNWKLKADHFSMTEYVVVGKQTSNGIPCHTPVKHVHDIPQDRFLIVWINNNIVVFWASLAKLRI